MKGQNGGEEGSGLSWVVQECIMEKGAQMGTVWRNPVAQKLMFHLVGGGPLPLPHPEDRIGFGLVDKHQEAWREVRV